MTNRLANIIVFLIEVGVGILCGVVIAVLALPIAYIERGYFAIGSEWLIIIGMAYAGFSATNKYIFEHLERS